MKKKISKKMVLSVITGAMVTVAVIGAGTYAWFTSSATIAASDFMTAKVALGSADGGYKVYNFLTGHAQNIEYQSALEDDQDGTVLAAWLANVNPDNQLMSDEYYAKMQGIEEYTAAIEQAQAEFEAAEAAWKVVLAKLTGISDEIDSLVKPTKPTAPNRKDYPGGKEGDKQYQQAYSKYTKALAKYEQELRDYNNKLNKLYQQLSAAEKAALEADGTQQALKDAYDTLVAAQQALFAKIAEYAVFVEADLNLVTPGALIYGTYTVTNESNVPTYFRLAEQADDLNGIGLVKAVAFNGSDVYALVYDNGYYYSPYALAAETEITLVIGAYILGAANENDVQGTAFSFGGTGVDLIQASNNAVYLDDSWNPATVTFIDYTNPTQP